MFSQTVGCASPPPPGSLEPPTDLPETFREPLPEAASALGSEASRDGAVEAELTGSLDGDPDRARAADGDLDLAWFADGDADLAALLDEAAQHNWDLEAAAARVEAADAQATIAGAGRYPSLDASLTRSRSKQNFIGLPIGGATGGVLTNTSTSYSASLSSSWEFDLWGRVRHGAVAANADREAAYADYAGARLSIAGQVAKSWYGVTEARLQAELAERTVASYEASTSQVRARFEEGTRTSLDLRLASSQLASARALLEQRQTALGAQVRQLEILVGRYPDRELAGADTLRTPTADVPSLVPADLLLRRPDLLAAERRWVAADHRTSQARRDLLPKISLTASGGRSSRELSDLLDGDFTVWSFVTNLFQPLFQGGRLRANVKLNDSARDQLGAAFANATLRAFAEVETLLESGYRLERQEEHLEEAVLQATAARELTESRYRSGLVDYINVLDAQRSELDARSRLLGVQADRLRNRVDLYIALGGGFESPNEILSAPDQSLNSPGQIPSAPDQSLNSPNQILSSSERSESRS
ncbi:MAG: efflux transporter outer membrane subunit [Candidatus Eisenbacteria bacterium]|uniref:Efflux transporter outer membrane subunit n=1 Tax=Eiseniibacteriota bacterium TaxID=2212470 RepID=A0A956NDU2_UNCEI|nr:efflux transporter outer membrane subunit [Candidatus Eisenbacteria bacterium]